MIAGIPWRLSGGEAARSLVARRGFQGGVETGP
jgi:hypothetical protein